MRSAAGVMPEWKLIVALPDFHFKPEIELYNLVNLRKNQNGREQSPDVV